MTAKKPACTDQAELHQPSLKFTQQHSSSSTTPAPLPLLPPSLPALSAQCPLCSSATWRNLLRNSVSTCTYSCFKHSSGGDLRHSVFSLLSTFTWQDLMQVGWIEAFREDYNSLPAQCWTWRGQVELTGHDHSDSGPKKGSCDHSNPCAVVISYHSRWMNCEIRFACQRLTFV